MGGNRVQGLREMWQARERGELLKREADDQLHGARSGESARACAGRTPPRGAHRMIFFLTTESLLCLTSVSLDHNLYLV